MKDLAEFLEVLGAALRRAGLDDSLDVSVVDEDGEKVDDLGTMKLPETKQ